MRTAAIGLLLTAVVAGILSLAMGPAALRPALIFGLVATVIQTLADWIARDGKTAPLDRFLVQRAYGTGLRLLGVVLIPVAVLARRDVFSPLPTALAYVAVLIPLLFMEIRLAR